MGIFSKIRDKIFGHDDHKASNGAPASATNVQTASPTRPATTPPASPATATASPEAASLPQVDVGAVLLAMADAKGGGGNYQSSIVDLLKLLDLDSSLAARKELADELTVHEGADGSAEQNVALHRAVMTKLAENGGVVPDSFRD
ncbi:DUF3597 domain-containing protein [Sphingobium sp.]|uniref:DUF3597 domain-containing protein n=1 Tax=Sphingobium sp. TaxID=1912891 RepID=UPI002BF41D18|nr:DUF3597 domain-containing protein [Sphingobium sp.]HUD90855.1 DUF3597 domain-containing protein [Sphingobium sp.]